MINITECLKALNSVSIKCSNNKDRLYTLHIHSTQYTVFTYFASEFTVNANTEL